MYEFSGSLALRQRRIFHATRVTGARNSSKNKKKIKRKLENNNKILSLSLSCLIYTLPFSHFLGSPSSPRLRSNTDATAIFPCNRPAQLVILMDTLSHDLDPLLCSSVSAQIDSVGFLLSKSSHPHIFSQPCSSF